MKRMGEVTLYWGTMFAGKSTRLITDLLRAGDGAICFKPATDTRDAKDVIVTHDGIEFPVTTVRRASEMFLYLEPRITTIGIEEVSLFYDDPTLLPTIKALRDMGYDLVMTGIDRNLKDEPFCQMGEVACLADNAIKLRATCIECGAPASMNYFKGEDKTNLIGRADKWDALCRTCYSKRG